MSDPSQMLKASAATQAMAALYSGVMAKRDADSESELLSQEARTSAQQSVAVEEAQRRQARQFLAMQSAAIGESGTGTGGSNRVLMQQSAIEAELEALNIRYAGQLRTQGLTYQSDLAEQRGKSALIGSGLAAGSALLSGQGDVLKAQSGLVQYGYPISGETPKLRRG
jgi:hypothetical protein